MQNSWPLLLTTDTGPQQGKTSIQLTSISPFGRHSTLSHCVTPEKLAQPIRLCTESKPISSRYHKTAKIEANLAFKKPECGQKAPPPSANGRGKVSRSLHNGLQGARGYSEQERAALRTRCKRRGGGENREPPFVARRQHRQDDGLFLKGTKAIRFLKAVATLCSVFLKKFF